MIRPRLNERIRFIGLVGGERKAQLMAGARCLLVPSLAPETSSLVAMEAMASGTPVVAFPSGALKEIVTHGRTGFLVNNAEEMADAIVECDSISPQACRAEAEQKFSSERMFAEYLDLYRAATLFQKQRRNSRRSDDDHAFHNSTQHANSHSTGGIKGYCAGVEEFVRAMREHSFSTPGMDHRMGRGIFT